jgi:hypothetical protein
MPMYDTPGLNKFLQMKNKFYLLFSPLAVVQNIISNILDNYFQNIFMKLAEKKWISLIAQTCLMLSKKYSYCSSGGGQFFFLGFPVSSFPAGWEALRPNCSVAHWDNKLAQSGSDRPSSMALCKSVCHKRLC